MPPGARLADDAVPASADANAQRATAADILDFVNSDAMPGDVRLIPVIPYELFDEQHERLCAIV
jgi:hypothetical protein